MDLTYTHAVLESAAETRRYFAKFERIIDFLGEVADISLDEKQLSAMEVKMLKGYLAALSNTFTALSYKYLMTDRVSLQTGDQFSLDKTESGFPVFREIMQMTADMTQASKHLISLPSRERLKKDMINHILTEKSAPTQLQFAMSQRIYYEYLAEGELFLTQNHPEVIWVGKDVKQRRRSYLIHWASYDSQTNLPVVYLMELDDTGSRALPHDERRWPRVQSHIMAQSVSGLKLLTIAQGFDRDFDTLHPKMLRRFHLGPMHSHDWALAWTVESLVSASVKKEKTGLFKSADREVYQIDKMDFEMADSGASDIRRALIMPHRAYQVLNEKYKADFEDVQKYVVGQNARILSYS